MTRLQIVATIARSLGRDRDLPLGQKTIKGVRYLTAALCGPIYLRACNRVGPYPRTLGRPYINNHGRIEIGGHFNLNSLFATTELATGPNGLIRIGNQVHVNYGTAIVAVSAIDIGDRTHIAQYSVISDTELADIDAFDSTSVQPITIEQDVWIGGRVIVMPGARIGAGSVIAAGSLVIGVIPAGVIAGGIPARVIRALDFGKNRVATEGAV